jgi:hypothetical protein
MVPVSTVSDPVSRNLERVFKKGDAPAHKYYSQQTQVFETADCPEFQMPVPGYGHKGIGCDQ